VALFYQIGQNCALESSTVQIAFQIMMQSGADDFCEDSEWPFQKLFRSIACIFIAAKKNES